MEGLGHGAFGQETGCIDFMFTMPTLLEERPRDQADTVLPERRCLNIATRAIPEREGARVLVLASWPSTLCRWPPKDGRPGVPRNRGFSGLAREVRSDNRLPRSQSNEEHDAKLLFAHRTELTSLGPNV